MLFVLLSPHPAPGTQALIWELIRGSGILAYVMLSLSTLLGMAITVRALDSVTRRAYVYEAHQTTSIVAIVMTGIHMVALLFDRFVGFSLVAVLVPFASAWRPLSVGIGVLAFYISVVVTATTYMRRYMRQETWRIIHYTSFIAWGFAALHGLTAGSDSSKWWVLALYLVTVWAVVAMLVFRLVSSRRAPPVTSEPAIEPSQTLAANS